VTSAWRLDCGVFDANSADPERHQARLQIAKPWCAHDDTRDPLSTALHRGQRGLVNETGAQRIGQHVRRFDGVDGLDRERSFVKS
jgi:hypothetical protein